MEIADLLKALEAARRAIGEHVAPYDCYASGPMTGNVYHDLVECPACTFIAMHEDIKNKMRALTGA